MRFYEIAAFPRAVIPKNHAAQISTGKEPGRPAQVRLAKIARYAMRREVSAKCIAGRCPTALAEDVFEGVVQADRPGEDATRGSRCRPLIYASAVKLSIPATCLDAAVADGHGRPDSTSGWRGSNFAGP
jgi:hypothetical protein